MLICIDLKNLVKMEYQGKRLCYTLRPEGAL